MKFTLNPNNPSDDLDFVIFELPAGVQNCGGKIPLLCMASGDSQFPSPCMGPTGIRESSSDLEETFNCSEGDDNFVAALNMVAGTSYALLINNFTNTGSGFSITFGGSGEFVGPDADFTASATTICAGESVTFTDASSFGLGNIVGWNWTFGPGAVPTTINTQGPHNVTFNQPGLQTIVLTIETSLGCVLTTTEVINVEQCCDSVNPLIVNFTNTDLECAEDADGIIDITTSSNFPPFNYNWSDGESTEDRNNLGPGEYTVTITDNIGCEEIISVTLTSPPAYVYDATITMPSCDGGTDGAVNVTVSGATPPYTIVWIDELTGAFLTNDEDLLNIPIGDYTQTISDANGCILENTFEVRELELELDPTVEAITEPLCNGDSNGSIVVDIINGTPPYLFDFNDGNGPVPENALENIIAGSYNVVVFDVNNCMGNFTFEVGQPDSLKVELATNNVSCFGFTDGIVTALATGGTLPYTYNWSVPTNPDNPELTELPIGNYFLTLVDNNGCTITADTFITQPPELFIDEIQVVDNVCFGGSDGSLTIIASGGVPPYEYSLDNVTYQADLSFFNLPAGDFVGYVRDANGCFLSDLATIAQPLPITLEVFEDQTVDLGFTAELLAVNDSPDPFTYSWSPSESLDCSDCPIVNALPVNTTTYVVTLETSNGCIVMDSVTVEVNKVRPVYIPNAFTPNGDGVNDQFLVFGGRAVAQVQRLVIYDRWGELVFEANNIPTDAPSFGWDGTFRGQALNPGVLVYYTEVEFIDGVVEVYKGDVTIIR
ncbi:MAG: gliding motility-associated C-terminal domain-containing protein [Bacteroidota bacterium]